MCSSLPSGEDNPYWLQRQPIQVSFLKAFKFFFCSVCTRVKDVQGWDLEETGDVLNYPSFTTQFGKQAWLGMNQKSLIPSPLPCSFPLWENWLSHSPSLFEHEDLKIPQSGSDINGSQTWSKLAGNINVRVAHPRHKPCTFQTLISSQRVASWHMRSIDMTSYHRAGPWHPTENCPSGCCRKTKERWPELAFSVATVSQEGTGVRMTFNFISLCLCLHAFRSIAHFHQGKCLIRKYCLHDEA